MVNDSENSAKTVSSDDRATTRTAARLPHCRQGASYTLVVQEGPDKPLAFVVDGRLERARLFIGQSPTCDFRLNDPHVSRRHACVEVESRGLRFTDLGSTNGSRVNGVAVLDALLQGGEQLRIGDTVLTVRLDNQFVVQLPAETRFGHLFGASAEMRRLYPLFTRLARADIPILIEGETGTGKEALAESLHEASPRASEPFVVFDCTTVTPSLIEATLFGHERGAFTGAVGPRRGLFEEAHNGTLFIDEIGDLEPQLQATLLRAVDRGQTRRLGATKWQNVNVRIIAATRRNLDAEVQAGRFRDDLLFRLGVGRVELPPLCARRGDVPLLAAMFWKQMGGGPEGLGPAFFARLEAHTWPGNVRELRNVVARHLVLGDMAQEGEIEPALRAETPQPSPPQCPPRDFLDEMLKNPVSYAVGRERVLDEFERRFVDCTLARHDGHVGKAAEAAGIGRRYFQVIRGRRRESP